MTKEKHLGSFILPNNKVFSRRKKLQLIATKENTAQTPLQVK